MNMKNKSQRKPLYLQISDYILEEIREGALKPNQKVICGEELQKKFGVSKITTEKAYKILMEKGIIFRIPGKGTFIAENHEYNKPLSLGTKTIAFICPSLKSHNIINILSGAEAILSEHGHRFRLVITKGSFATQETLIRNLLNEGIDGMIIYPVEGKYYDEEILRMALSRYPLVLVDKHFPKIKTSYVISNNKEGCYLGTKRLLSQGHRNIAFFSSYSEESSTSIHDRIEGFRRAMTEAGILNWRSLVLDGFDEDVGTRLSYDQEHREIFIKRIKAFVEANRSITAAMAISPGNLSHVVNALRAMGHNTLSHIELAIFDMDEYLNFNRDPILSINQRSFEIGKKAAEILLNQIENPENIQEVVLDMDIKIV
jgi:DNA-binding LacI/PurR family transcriptional regulator